ncbi:hypothetical protein D3C77_720280 [compost metagenome]
MQADRLTAFPAPAVFAAGQTFEGFINLVEQLLLPFQPAQLPLALLFGAADVGGVAAGLALAQAFEFFGDPGLQFGAQA